MLPRGIDGEMHKTIRRIKNAAVASYRDRYAKELDRLDEGDIVRMQPMTRNNKA